MRPFPRPSVQTPLLLAALLAAEVGAASPQLGSLVSPGPLSKAHASLEGLASCEKCHERGKGVSASKCVACHRPVAERIAARRGVHRDVNGDCTSCHVEHAGVDAELRPFETEGFDHRAETGFPLEGRHAPLAGKCEACHRTRSFLKADPACSSCHADVHKGRLGADCLRCHDASVPFREARSRFDHAKAAFALTGAHRTVACGKCHKDGAWKGLRFDTCASCHADPHRAAFGADCASCHTEESFRTRKVDHARTRFPLRGRHAAVACERCHAGPALKKRPAFDRCAACHQDPHRGTFRQDCAACHTESGFRGAPFDHAAKTTFALTGRHAEVPCAACHRPKGPPAVPANGPPRAAASV
ncbi:hypothetical protein FBQ97_15370, partial [Acidobacteria bacterium ACD]|nr:hypothetical protein [Acidobacteria bacterium ACD]